jgi:hypothetical protein
MNKYVWDMGGIIIPTDKRSGKYLVKKPVPAPLFTTEIPHGMTWN